ncbi:hypothetical protein [Falsiroseomonas sp. E2-1-a20]|uniref:hypothetical protein n=1 Tax=Falsiroseomonas sp. E2-1-a20 TaxID=3239300 RepID=UPI003F335722
MIRSIILLGLLAVQPVQAQSGWPEVKCARYGEATAAALAHFGRQGVSQAFLDRHAAFLASGCTGQRDVCPRSPAELTLADALSIAAMNGGATGSFLPFACRD